MEEGLCSRSQIARQFEEDRMSLLRSICCLFAGRCAGEEPKPMRETMRGEAPVSEGDLGQKEAELEKTGKEQMSHMGGGDAGKTAQQRPTKRGKKSGRRRSP
jgi:hypothetical protein